METVLNLATRRFSGLKKSHLWMSGAFLFALCTLVLANSTNAQSSSYAGRYKGEWTAKPAPLASFKSGEEEHTGTWDITIDSDGEITGTEVDETSGKEGKIKGFIDERGFINLSVKYQNTSKMKGKLTKNGIRLTGKINQWCGTDDDDLPCLKIDIVLKRQ